LGAWFSYYSNIYSFALAAHYTPKNQSDFLYSMLVMAYLHVHIDNKHPKMGGEGGQQGQGSRMGHAGGDMYVKTVQYDVERWGEVPIAESTYK
jgi:hypothetical protein